MDDNELTSTGFAAGLDSCSDIELTATLDHSEALGWTHQWRQVDVALVDAADEQVPGDHFPGVPVVRHIRACQGDRRLAVVVVTGHFLNDGLRHRMAEADADLFFLRSDLRTFKALREVVLFPERFRRGVPPVADPDARATLGVTDRSRVEELVHYIDHHGLAESLGGPTSGTSRQDPRSRSWVRHRRLIGEVAKIEPVNLTTGHAPTRRQTTPSLRQLGTIYRWAARVHPVDKGPDD